MVVYVSTWTGNRGVVGGVWIGVFVNIIVCLFGCFGCMSMVFCVLVMDVFVVGFRVFFDRIVVRREEIVRVVEVDLDSVEFDEI